MNTQSLKHYADMFKREVIDSGFKRDLDDFISSLPASQQNILALREIAEKVRSSLDRIYDSDLREALRALLPTEKLRPFTEGPYNKELRELTENTEIPQTEFFSRLQQLLNKLKIDIEKNESQISQVVEFIAPYLAEGRKQVAAEGAAIIAIVFHDQSTITSLTHFSKTIALWNRTLPIYHQLLKSASPEDVRLIEVQNGSIDVILNIDVDVAIDLAEVFTIGFKVFSAYLAYKKIMKPIVDSYHGNKELIALENKKEALLLENIGEAVKVEIDKQHKEAKKGDKAVDGTAIKAKIDQVANLVTAHIVKGNDLKVLALDGEHGEHEDDLADIRGQLTERSSAARRELRQVSTEEQQKLLEKYGELEEAKEK